MKGFAKILTLLTGTALMGGAVTADQLINPYTQNGSKLETASESTIVESGSEKVTVDTTRPKITLEKFNGEVKMGVTYDGLEASGSRPFLSKNVEWRGTKQTMEVVPLEKTATMEDGGYEINILLSEKPVSNVFTFSIDGWENLDFFYQPALTDEEIKEGVFRPDNVVSSYAVYYKNHANHIEGQTNYATGKVYHIFRPKVTDAKGNEIWAEMSYTDGILTVTVPQDFLNQATYPVKVDPTFGLTTCGATGASMVVDNGGSYTSSRLGEAFSAPADGTITDINNCANTDNGSAVNQQTTMYVNQENGGGAGTHTQIGSSEATLSYPTTKAFVTISSLSISITNGTSYVLNSLINGTSLPSLKRVTGYYDTVTSNNEYLESNTDASAATAYSTMKENPWTSAVFTGTRKVSVYATYTASAATAQSNKATLQSQGILMEQMIIQ